jgi:uncharacterized protein with WD repeat
MQATFLWHNPMYGIIALFGKNNVVRYSLLSPEGTLLFARNDFNLNCFSQTNSDVVLAGQLLLY